VIVFGAELRVRAYHVTARQVRVERDSSASLATTDYRKTTHFAENAIAVGIETHTKHCLPRL